LAKDLSGFFKGLQLIAKHFSPEDTQRVIVVQSRVSQAFRNQRAQNKELEKVEAEI